MIDYIATPNHALIGGLGPWELALIFLIVLLLFGANKLPRIAKDVGSGIREFKKSLSGEKQEEENKNNNSNNNNNQSS